MQLRSCVNARFLLYYMRVVACQTGPYIFRTFYFKVELRKRRRIAVTSPVSGSNNAPRVIDEHPRPICHGVCRPHQRGHLKLIIHFV